MDVDFDVEVVALSGGAGTVSEHDARARHPSAASAAPRLAAGRRRAVERRAARMKIPQ
ncbi:hypothetical protein O978_23470 [Mycobacterium avium subsp. paratuberculosis 10-5864]|nr:hypothetical protein O978_23470 [Mycobacterium avium subsp. paratuberculosis 10-5864]